MSDRCDLNHEKHNWIWCIEEHLSLKNIAFNAVLKLKLNSTTLFEHIPRKSFETHGFILDSLRNQNLYTVASYKEAYSRICKQTHTRFTSPVTEMRLRRNLFRNIFGMTDCFSRKNGFIIQFRHTASPIIHKRLNLHPQCHCDRILYENLFTGKEFVTKIHTRKYLYDRILKRRIDFPFILPHGVRETLKEQDQKVTREILKKLGVRCIRISFCIRKNDLASYQHFHSRIIFKKVKPSDNWNVENRSSRSFGIINLLSPIQQCPNKTMSDY